MPIQLEHDSWRYLVVWEFEVRPGCESEFEKVYGSTGDWVRLFRTANGFVRTELTRKGGSPRHYITLIFGVQKKHTRSSGISISRSTPLSTGDARGSRNMRLNWEDSKG
jgi:hypothetical protein